MASNFPPPPAFPGPNGAPFNPVPGPSATGNPGVFDPTAAVPQAPPLPPQQQQQQVPTPARPAQGEREPEFSPATAERERAAEEALMASLEHVVSEYVRQDLLEQLGAHKIPGLMGRDARPTTSAPGEVVFVPGSCRHNTRIAVLLATVLFGILPLLSTASFTVAIVGCMAVYAADYLNYRHGSILATMLSLAAFGISLWAFNFSSAIGSAGGIMMLLDVALVLVIVFCWAVIQYHWIQLQFPELVCCLERLVLGVLPFLTLPMLLSTTIAFFGANNGAFVWSVVLCSMHFMCFTRLRSSFTGTEREVKSENEAEAPSRFTVYDFVTGRMEARAFSLLTFALPFMTYLMLQSNWAPDRLTTHMVNCAALIGIPTAYLFLLPNRTMWFLMPQGDTLLERMYDDPLELWHSVKSSRGAALTFGLLIVMHWFVYRTLHSRYAYLFSGMPAPWNGIGLCVVCYLFTFVAFATAIMLMADARSPKDKGEPVISKSTFALLRVAVLIASLIGTLLFGMVSGVPGFFLPMSALAAATFNAYLLDRRMVNNFFMFATSSSVLLLFWMYKTFSYVIVDLVVLNDSVVPTPVLAVSILWCYLMGIGCFHVAFSPSKSFLRVLIGIWALKVAWIEHVLYSQKEANTYPGMLVIVTSAAGIIVTHRLYKNGVLPGDVGTGVVIGLWFAKIVTFFQEVTQAEFIGDYSSDFSRLATTFRAMEVTVGHMAAALAAAALFTLEVEAEEKKKRKDPALLTGFIVSALTLAMSCRRNAMRAAFDAISHADQEYTWVRQIGIIAVITGIACIPIMVRHGGRFPGTKTVVMGLMAIGCTLLVVDPVVEAVVDPEEDDGDISFLRPHGWARILSTVVAALAIIGRFIPFASKNLPAVLRMSYWGLVSVLGSIALSGMLLPATNLHVMVAVCAFVTLSAVVIDICHYSHCEQYVAWILYATSVGAMIVSFVTLNAVDLSSFTDNEVYAYEAHSHGRFTLLSISFAVNFALGLMLKARLSGSSLLPKPTPLSGHIVQQVGLVCNYAVLLAVITAFIITYYNAEGSPLLFVSGGLLCLLLHDDNILFFDLRKEYFRYFPPFAAIMTALWGMQFQNAWGAAQMGGISAAASRMFPAALLIPSHASAAFLLCLGKRRAGVSKAAVTFFFILDAVVLLLARQELVRWLAAVGICAQASRLFAAEFWKRTRNTLL